MRQRRLSKGAFAALVVIFAIIGLGAVYVITGLLDNVVEPNTAATQPSGKTTDTPAVRRQDARRFSTGDMATFVFKDEPAALPAFTFMDRTGAKKSLMDWRGKLVLLNLWATWCGPCRKEMPYLDKLQATLGGENFDVVAISIDRGSPDKPKAFLAEIGLTNLAFYHDPTAQLGFTLKAIGMPATLLIDQQGREIGRLVGPAEWASEDALRLIRAHLPKTAESGADPLTVENPSLKPPAGD